MTRIHLLLIFILSINSLFSQQDFSLIKAEDSKIVIDGILSDYEKNIGVVVPVEYEQEPGDNTPTKVKTDVYVLIRIPTFILV